MAKDFAEYQPLAAAAAEGEETLAYVVHPHKQTHPAGHGDIIPHAEGGSGKEAVDQGFGDAVGKDIANGDIQGKAEGGGPAAAGVAKGKIAVEEIAHDAGQSIAEGGGEPVAPGAEIVQKEHEAVADDGIDHADQGKFPELFVK